MASLTHRVRVALARRFFVALRRATHRMPTSLEAVTPGRVMVVAPHIDDEAIACGGTLLLHRAVGSEVRIVFVSDSSAGIRDPHIAAQVRGVRRGEMASAAAVLGIASIGELDLPDGSLVRHETAIAERLAQELAAFRPTQVLCPFPIDGHADHQATAIGVAAAARRAGWQGEVLAYEVWAPLWANLAIDITPVAAQKAALIALYASQMADRDYAGATLGLNRYRGLQHRVDFAEAFHRCTPAEFAELTECLDRID